MLNVIICESKAHMPLTQVYIISYVQTVPNHWRLLIIDDKSLPHKQRRASTRLLIFKIKFLSEPPVDD